MNSSSKPVAKPDGIPWSLVFSIAFVAAVLFATYMLFVEAPPPRKLVIATGAKEGAYYQFAEQYAKILQKQGLTLEVKATNGSVENLALLQDDSSGVAVALVQSGVADSQAAAKLESLGSLYREPLWVFLRKDRFPEETRTLKALENKTLAIGPVGSGTRAVAQLLLKQNEVSGSGTKLLDLTGQTAADALKKEEIDAGFFVASIEAHYILDLLKTDKVVLFAMDQQGAYLRRFRFFAGASLPAGLIDLGRNVPDKEVPLIAATAMLVARNDLHPALVGLLLEAATKVHSGGDMLSHPDEFPSPKFVDIPLNENARHFFKSGPPVLQRILPFWLASLVDRLKVMLIPLLVLLMPLIRSAPPLMRWRTRRKIYRWYRDLRGIDMKLQHGLDPAEAEGEIAKLKAIEEQVAHVAIPLSYMEEFYNLRLHLELIDEKLKRCTNTGQHPAGP
jgi:TRAP transporter TAXI family solute receptor